MAWVASDPEGRAATSVVLPQRASVALDIEEVHEDGDAAVAARSASWRASDDDEDGLVPADPEVHRRAPLHRAALLRPSVPALASASPAPEERVEISIGTIHLHVDAPPQPVAAATPAPAPAAPSLRPPTPRSSLSRRALYRL